MREINVNSIIDTLEEMCIEANCVLNSDVEDALKNGYESETSEIGKDVLGNILKNAQIALGERRKRRQQSGDSYERDRYGFCSL